jgi:hypothetical protein
MPSAAKSSFERALIDVDNVLWFHANEGGDGRGKRGKHFESLNKSAAVLLCAAWEIYVETVIMECVDRNLEAATVPTEMLKSLQKLTQAHVRNGKVENAWQSVAGEGWKDLTRSLAQSRVGGLNTPKPGPITELMDGVLGIDDIKDNWSWHKNPIGTPADKLKAFVSLRGGIAHGEQLEQTLTKAKVEAAYQTIMHLVDCVEAKLVEEDLLDDDGED